MNRRGFFKALGAVAAGFSILPAATTYTRLWKAVKPTGSLLLLPNPDYINAPFETIWFAVDPAISKVKPLIFRREVPCWAGEVELANIESPFEVVKDRLPVRFKIGANGQLEVVPPVIQRWSKA